MIFTFDGRSAFVAGASMLFGDAFAGPMGGGDAFPGPMGGGDAASRLLRLRWFRSKKALGGVSSGRTQRRRR